MAHKSTIVRLIKIVARVGRSLAPGLSARLLERLFLTPIRHTTPQREQEWLASAQRSSVRFDDKITLPLYVWGKGPTVLVVHGWSGRGSQMGAFVQPLVEQGYRVVAFDAVGHGRADGKMTGLPEIATAIERVVAKIGPVVGIVAHSLGTAATTVAISRGLSVDKVVYIAPPENPGNYLQRAAHFLGFGEAIARLSKIRIEKRFGFTFESAHGTKLAPTIQVPLLVIHDAGDKEVPYQEGVQLAKSWPGARLKTTQGLGHSRILRTPEVIAATTSFLAPPEHLL